MKTRLAFFLLLLLCCCGAASAQTTTTVTLTVTDAPDSQNWNNGTYATYLIQAFGSSNNFSSPGPSGVLNSSGVASFSLTQNSVTNGNANTQWSILVCPQMGCAVTQ